jgi:CRP/FNR family transcriptional regulator, cyclic AMP receptor protein
MDGQIKDIAHKASVDFLIRHIPFLACLTHDEVANIRNIVIERQVSKNQIILQEEETSNFFYFIYSGEVKIIQISLEGKERIIAIHKRGEYFGEMSILDGKTLPATVVAMEDTRIGLISRENFTRYLLSNERVLKELIGILCGRLRDSWLMLKVISFADAEQRVRVVLKNIGDHFGIKDQRGVVIALRLTHNDIANLASISRETVTRTLNRLENEGEIEILDGKKVLMKRLFLEKNDIL